MDKVKGKEWDVSERVLIAKINRERRLMYYFDALNGMQPVYQSAKNCGFKDWIYRDVKDSNEPDNILL